MLYAVSVRNELQNNMKMHHTATMLFIIACLLPIKFVLSLGYWFAYSAQGKQRITLWVLSLIVDNIVTTIFILLFLCLGSGWAIYRRKLPAINRLRMTFFVTVYLTLSIASACWMSTSDDLRINYMSYYSSPPGVLVLVLLTVAGIRFNVLLSNMLTKFAQSPAFFLRLRAMGTIFMLTQPLAALFSLGGNSAYRAKTIMSIWSIIVFLYELLLLLLYDPRVIPSEFPFHAHIQEMNDIDNDASKFGGISGGTAAIVDEGEFYVVN